MNIICFSSHTAGGLMCDLMNNTPLDQVVSNSIRGRETEKNCDYPMYTINNREHSMLKGLIMSPTKSSYTNVNVNNGAFSEKIYYSAIAELRSSNKSLDTWVGSHHHPTVIPDRILTNSKVIVVTNERYTSRLLLFIRIVYGLIKLGKGVPHWHRAIGISIKDEVKEAILAAGFDVNDPLDDSIMFNLFRDNLNSFLRHFENRWGETSANNIWRPHSLCQNVEFEDIVNGNFVRDNNLNIEVFNYWKSINSFLYQEPDQKLKEYFDNSLL